MKRSYYLNILIISLLTLLTLSCSQKTPTQNNVSINAPQIPPGATLSIDFSMFNNSGTLAKATHTLSKNNYLAAAIRATMMKSSLAMDANLPVIALESLRTQQPELDQNGKYHWKCQCLYESQPYHFELVGREEKDQIAWEMYYSTDTAKNEQGPKALLFEGRSELAGNKGSWLVREKTEFAESGNPIKLDWTMFENGDRILAISNPTFNQKLIYSVLDNKVKIQFSNYPDDYNVEIEWNKTNGSGYLIVPGYNENQKAYWDENQDDLMLS